jgi:hypothetical protein
MLSPWRRRWNVNEYVGILGADLGAMNNCGWRENRKMKRICLYKSYIVKNSRERLSGPRKFKFDRGRPSDGTVIGFVW